MSTTRHRQIQFTSDTLPKMWWGKSSDSQDPKASSLSSSPKETTAAATAEGAPADPRYAPKSSNDTAAPSDPAKLPERQKLSPALQKIVDKQEKDENFFDELVDG